MLNNSVSTIKGIGLAMEEKLNSLEIYTIIDLLKYYPYQTNIYDVTAVEVGKVFLRAKVLKINRAIKIRAISYFTMDVLIDDAIYLVKIFNRNFLISSFNINDYYYFKGDLKANTITVSDFYIDQSLPIFEMKYHTNKQITDKSLKRCIDLALNEYLSLVTNTCNQDLIDKYKLMNLQEAIYLIHHPKNIYDYQNSLRTLKYYEAREFLLQIEASKKTRIKRISKEYTKELIVKQALDFLPFDLTLDQLKVIEEIRTDFNSDYLMNRLLHGDVGSGKTVVSAISILMKKGQTAILVPTEILAQQHYDFYNDFLSDFNLKGALLTSSTSKKQREEILAKLALDQLDYIVGTHSLLNDEVVFADLKYVITDEQHRFGVRQREKLHSFDVDVLLMSATPIPRSLALTFYGDLSVSVIKTMPANRKKIKTYNIEYNLNNLKSLIASYVDKSQQVYIVCSRVEKTKDELFDVYSTFDLFKDDFACKILHGKMKSSEKSDAIDAFKNGKIDVLISTTVIEVGIDVSNATCMIILDAFNYGLAQLHQMRGRVGRSDLESACYLVSVNKTARLTIMENTYDGFTLSEEDLKLRGPGQFFGTKQSGSSLFKLIDLYNDYAIISTAKQDLNL